ncbi:hypothetical protein Pint_29281 [Pistacia integerrima]|uniref:Uncharacterized protein n=1 Tax=Pistacia integerrima TaxID=434235 RepID=A0ACC0X2G9_9ROSI|nr:hypothetical protein Pint_29281 [Pistacia integerrima]
MLHQHTILITHNLDRLTVSVSELLHWPQIAIWKVLLFLIEIDLLGILSNRWNFEICVTEQNDYFETFKLGPMAKSLRKQNEEVLIARSGLMEQILSAFILMKSRLLGRDQTQKGSGGHYLGLFLGSDCSFLLVSYKDETHESM